MSAHKLRGLWCVVHWQAAAYVKTIMQTLYAPGAVGAVALVGETLDLAERLRTRGCDDLDFQPNTTTLSSAEQPVVYPTQGGFSYTPATEQHPPSGSDLSATATAWGNASAEVQQETSYYHQPLETSSRQPMPTFVPESMPVTQQPPAALSPTAISRPLLAAAEPPQAAAPDAPSYAAAEEKKVEESTAMMPDAMPSLDGATLGSQPASPRRGFLGGISSVVRSGVRTEFKSSHRTR